MPHFQSFENYTRLQISGDDTIDPRLPQGSSIDFIRSYTGKIDSLDLSGPFSAWYAPSAVFYNGDGKIYDGGRAIWEWMHSLFGLFAKLEHLVKTTRVLGGVNSVGPMCDLFVMETETHFWLKAPLDGEAIHVPRLLMFLVGPEEIQGEGTDGLQIWEAKAYWDTAVLEREVKLRQTAQKARRE